MQDHEAVIIAVEDVVDVFRSLLGHRNVFGIARRELNHIVRCREDTHQAGQDCLHRVAHIVADDLRAAILFVAKRLAAIVFGCLGADGRDNVVDKVHRIVNFRPDNALQFVVTHVIRINESIDLVGQIVFVRIHMLLLSGQKHGADRIASLGSTAQHFNVSAIGFGSAGIDGQIHAGRSGRRRANIRLHGQETLHWRDAAC